MTTVSVTISSEDVMEWLSVDEATADAILDKFNGTIEDRMTAAARDACEALA